MDNKLNGCLFGTAKAMGCCLVSGFDNQPGIKLCQIGDLINPRFPGKAGRYLLDLATANRQQR